MMNATIKWLKTILGDLAYGLERFCGRYYGVYAGQCIDNVDPQGRGRIRAICPAIGHTQESDVSANAWMTPSMNGVGVDPDTGQMSGNFMPPDEKMNVWIMFENGDPKSPIYIGGWITTKNESPTFGIDDPKGKGLTKRGIRTRAGHFLRFNDDPDALEITISKGDGEGAPTAQFISLTKEGSTLITNKNGSNMYMNAEDNETSISNLDEDGNVLSMLLLGDNKISLITKDGGAYGIDGKDHVLSGDNVIADCSKQFSANAGTVMLGKGAKEPVMRGNKFTLGFGLIHQHTTTAPGAPTVIGPTPPPMLFNELSESVFIS